MSDNITTMAELKASVLAFAEERDWIQFHSPKNLSMALAAEAAELMEHFLWSGSEASRDTVHQESRRQEIREELADILIFAMEFANVSGIDLTEAIKEKMVLNASKYPVEKARGRSAKYTEL